MYSFLPFSIFRGSVSPFIACPHLFLPLEVVVQVGYLNRLVDHQQVGLPEPKAFIAYNNRYGSVLLGSQGGVISMYGNRVFILIHDKGYLPTAQVSAWLPILSVVLLLALNPTDLIRRIPCNLMPAYLTDVDDRFRNIKKTFKAIFDTHNAPLSITL